MYRGKDLHSKDGDVFFVNSTVRTVLDYGFERWGFAHDIPQYQMKGLPVAPWNAIFDGESPKHPTIASIQLVSRIA